MKTHIIKIAHLPCVEGVSENVMLCIAFFAFHKSLFNNFYVPVKEGCRKRNIPLRYCTTNLICLLPRYFLPAFGAMIAIVSPPLRHQPFIPTARAF